MHTQIIFKRYSAALILSAALPLYAQTGDDQALELNDPLVVTATRQDQNLSETLASTSVIDRELIERSQAQDLLELLRLQPGVDIVRTGSTGGQTSIFLRGANSNQVLVLIDGVRVSSANTGLFTFENLPLQQIDRIEIVRGPRASYYGSDAIGGVIQIFTRRGDGLQLRAGYGSEDSFQVSTSNGWRGSQGGITGTVSYRDTNGFSAQNPDGFSFDPDDDGYRNLGLSLVGDYRLGNGVLDFTVLASDAETQFDQGISDSVNQAFRLGYGFGHGQWQHQIQASYSRDNLSSDFTGDFGGFQTRFESDRIQLSWLSEFAVNQHLTLLGGIDAYEEFGEDQGNFDDDRHNIGGFAGANYRYQKHSLDGSLRVDDDENFGTELTGQIAYGYNITEALEVVANYGRGFRSPTLNQLFSPGFGGLFAGNPNLEPETSNAYELSLRYTLGSHRFSINGFHQDLNQLIDFAGDNFQAINIQQASITGVELDYQWQSKHWVVAANATFQNAENDNTDEPLLRRPDEKGSISVDYRFANGGWAGVEVFYSGDSFDFGGTRLDDYVLVNLRAGYPLWRGLRIEGRIENLFDETYAQAFGFNTQDLAGFINLSWSQ